MVPEILGQEDRSRPPATEFALDLVPVGQGLGEGRERIGHQLTPSPAAAGALVWDCTAGSMPARYRPSNCR